MTENPNYIPTEISAAGNLRIDSEPKRCSSFGPLRSFQE